MDDSFEIPVTWKGEEMGFTASLIKTGYTYKIATEVFGQLVYFEPDEEGHYRVIADPASADGNHIDPTLLMEIAAVLHSVTG